METMETSTPHEHVLAQHDIQVPTEDGILAILNLTRSQFCRKHGFDQVKAEQQRVARQLTLHMIHNLQRRLIARGVTAAMASYTAFAAVVGCNQDSPFQCSEKGFARGLEHSTQDVELFLAMNDPRNPLLPTSTEPPGNLEHGPGKNAAHDPFIGWPGVSPDALALQAPETPDLRGYIAPAHRLVLCVDPKMLSLPAMASETFDPRKDSLTKIAEERMIRAGSESRYMTFQSGEVLQSDLRGVSQPLSPNPPPLPGRTNSIAHVPKPKTAILHSPATSAVAKPEQRDNDSGSLPSRTALGATQSIDRIPQSAQSSWHATHIDGL